MIFYISGKTFSIEPLSPLSVNTEDINQYEV